MRNRHGYTYVEMLVSIIISSFIVLTVAAVSGVSQRSYHKVMTEAGVYSDITYGYKLLQSRVRGAKSLSIQAAGGQWCSAHLMINGQQAFGLYQPSAGANIEFVYMKDVSDPSAREVIFHLASDETMNLNITLSGKSVTFQLSGQKSKVPFNIATTVARRT